MIDRNEMMEKLVDASPSFLPAWKAFLKKWKGGEDGKGLPYYLALSEFANHVARVCVQKQAGELPAIFGVVEELHLHGDPYVREAATTGLLEALQHALSEAHLAEDALAQYLKPESLKWWNKLIAYREYGEPLVDRS